MPVARKEPRAYFIYMDTYKIRSVFFGETAIFHYPAERKTDKAVLILKGLYGKHIPENAGENPSWDNQLIGLLRGTYEIFIFNTGRYDAADKRESLEGKMFQNECDDVQEAFAFCRENILKEKFTWEAVAISFGGTTLLGCSDVLHVMQGVVMIGSGCGKSLTTTKPLVSTLLDTKELLKSISDFTGSLYFLHGGKDTIVSVESQKKIYESATRCFSRGWIEFPGLDHELNDLENGISHTAILAQGFLEVAS